MQPSTLGFKGGAGEYFRTKNRPRNDYRVLICTFYEKNTPKNTPFLVPSKKTLKSNCLGVQNYERISLCLHSM